MSYFVNLAKANAEVKRLSEQLSAVTGERETLKTALAERDAAAESCRAQFDATLADLTEKMSVATKEISDLKAAAETAGKKAAAIVASQGIEAPKTPPAEPAAAASGAELLAQLNACKTPLERARFIKENQATLSKLTRN